MGCLFRLILFQSDKPRQPGRTRLRGLSLSKPRHRLLQTRLRGLSLSKPRRFCGLSLSKPRHWLLQTRLRGLSLSKPTPSHHRTMPSPPPSTSSGIGYYRHHHTIGPCLRLHLRQAQASAKTSTSPWAEPVEAQTFLWAEPVEAQIITSSHHRTMPSPPPSPSTSSGIGSGIGYYRQVSVG